MQAQSILFSLPPEIRHSIYEWYVYDGGGYRFDSASHKFRMSNNQPIDLALMYTCKSIAAEMHGIALNTNTLVFSTTSSKADSALAARFHWTLLDLEYRKDDLLNSTQRYLNSQMKEKLALKHNRLARAFDHTVIFAARGRRLAQRGWGESRLAWRRLVEDTLQLLWDDENDTFVEHYRQHLHRYRYWPENMDKPWTDADVTELAQFITTRPNPWAIPSDEEVSLLEMHRHGECGTDKEDEQFHMKYARHRFSAAAVAINFLQSTSPLMLLQVRSILLCEDRVSVAFPECHGMGLLKLCQNYPQLHIERRVYVWRNLLLDGSDHELCNFPLFRVADYREGRLDPESLDLGLWDDPKTEDSEQLQSSEISNSFCSWIEETLELYDAGMPAKSFSLVFDAEGAPERTSEVFEIVKRDAVWQEALDMWYKKKCIRPTFDARRSHACYHSERFPQAVTDLVTGKSPIRCNFPVGVAWEEMERVLEENMDAEDSWDWRERWEEKLVPKTFQTAPPLPSWLELRLDQVNYTQKQWDALFDERRRYQEELRAEP